jgi:hypothetical protein
MPACGLALICWTRISAPSICLFFLSTIASGAKADRKKLFGREATLSDLKRHYPTLSDLFTPVSAYKPETASLRAPSPLTERAAVKLRAGFARLCQRTPVPLFKKRAANRYSSHTRISL